MNLSATLTLLIGVQLVFCSFQAKSEIELDASFGNHAGYVTTNVSTIGVSNDFANTMVRLSNGDLLVAGQSDDKVAVVKYDENGDLVSGFVNNGILLTELSTSEDLGTSLLLQGSDKFLISGVENNQLIVARYTLSGSLDTDFAESGYFRSPLVDGNSQVAMLLKKSNGNLLLVGGFADAQAHPVEGGLLIEFDSEGNLVTSFGDNGVVKFIHQNGYASFFAASMQSDDKILAAGIVEGSNFYSDMLVTRFDLDGNLDSNFAQSGVFIRPESSAATAIIQATNGNIITVGYSEDNSGISTQVVGLKEDGSLNSAFGNNGIYLPDSLSGGIGSFKEEREHLIFAGTGDTSYLTRTTLNGVIDADFGTNGVFQLPQEVKSVGSEIVYFEGAYFMAGGDLNTYGESGNITLAKVIDTDYIPEPTLIKFVQSNLSVNESVGNVSIQVTRAGTIGIASSVDYLVTSGTAVESTDFTLNDGTINFSIGETEKNIIANIIDDGEDETNEIFTINLTNPVDAELGDSSNIVISIIDNDLDQNDIQGSSGGGGLSFILTLLLLFCGVNNRKRKE